MISEELKKQIEQQREYELLCIQRVQDHVQSYTIKGIVVLQDVRELLHLAGSLLNKRYEQEARIAELEENAKILSNSVLSCESENSQLKKWIDYALQILDSDGLDYIQKAALNTKSNG